MLSSYLLQVGELGRGLFLLESVSHLSRGQNYDSLAELTDCSVNALLNLHVFNAFAPEFTFVLSTVRIMD